MILFVKPRKRSTVISLASIFYSPNGNRSSTLGSWRTGRRIATLPGSAERPDYRSRSARYCGQSSSAFGPGLKSRRLITYAELFTSLAATLWKSGKVVFDFAVVDEAQDVSVAHIRFLAALGNGRPNALFFAGDLGQRIFQQPFSWKSLGVDVRGRSRTLRVKCVTGDV
jgi:UvrD/REP helicase N-terminal domain